MRESHVTGIWEAGEGLALSQADMEKINRYTRREYRPEEVYVFSMVLCDNQVDRDGERFPAASLEKLRELFLGKTCVFDHQTASAGQTARIFDTALAEDGSVEAEGGEPLTQLTARAYLPRLTGTQEVIELIDSGMLKEVSVNCAVKRRVCSLCGKEACQHQPGQPLPGGGAVHRLLLEPTDAYECSFVAVPAQKGAGVIKRHGQLGAFESDRRRIQLEEEAQWDRKYREGLTAEILKCSALVQPDLPREVMKAAVEGLSMEGLDAMGRSYRKLAQKSLPLRPQLAPEEDKGCEDRNGAFRI